jgi:quercetin dioxygenase-like cupin family protein
VPPQFPLACAGLRYRRCHRRHAKVAPMMRHSGWSFGWVVIALAALCSGSAGVAKEEPGFVRIAPAEVKWRDIPGSHGAQQAILVGDPNQPGMYVVRVKFPAHVMTTPHWHPNARYVTVLEGTWYAGTGNTFDVAKAVPLKVGSFMLHPAKAVHWDGSAGNEPVIVQIIGEGPTVGGQVDPKQPRLIEVPR